VILIFASTKIYLTMSNQTFTIDQIRAVHSKVKTGADFPAYIQDMKKLGIKRYEHYLSDGHIKYYGAEGFTISADAKWPERKIADHAQKEKFRQAISVHQQGGSDYPTICVQAADMGIEKWIVDIEKMTCTYYDKSGNELIVEHIPAV
jgi:uncharacterized protein YbcV (DUF1398 family)